MAKSKTTTPRNTSDQATQYAKRVTAGKVMAGPHVRAACARHLLDLEKGPKRGLKWDKAAAARAIGFFADVLRLNGGEYEGVPFVLEPWQAFIVGSLYGWKAPDGYRRFRVAYIEAGKGSGKSPLAAGIGHYGLVADNEPRAEIYAAATKKDQAMVLFRDAVAMVDQSPPLSRKLTKSGTGQTVWNLAYLATGSFFRPISSDDGQSGPRPHVALIDEIHEHKTAHVVDMMRAGTKGRRQALIFMITNSGFDRTSVCFHHHDYGAKVSAGELQDDSFFAYICGLDDDDDPFASEDCWPKANPSLGVTFQPKYLRELVTGAYGMPSKESVVRRLNFCQWVDASNPWIDGDLWRSCLADFDDEVVKGLPLFLGLDLSGKRDLTALAQVWKAPDRLYARVTFWTPADTLEERARVDMVPYGAWVTSEDLLAVPGRSINFAYVAQHVAAMQTESGIDVLAFDQWRIEDFLRELDAVGVQSYIYDAKEKNQQGLCLHRHGQGWAGGASENSLWMPRSIGLLEDAVMNRTISVQPNPALNWAAASAVLAEDPAGNKKWEKRKSTGRIDGIVALSMAVGAAMAGETDGPSVYEERGVLTL
jgi:phage terminase large subunit-like protein